MAVKCRLRLFRDFPVACAVVFEVDVGAFAALELGAFAVDLHDHELVPIDGDAADVHVEAVDVLGADVDAVSRRIKRSFDPSAFGSIFRGLGEEPAREVLRLGRENDGLSGFRFFLVRDRRRLDFFGGWRFGARSIGLVAGREHQHADRERECSRSCAEKPVACAPGSDTWGQLESGEHVEEAVDGAREALRSFVCAGFDFLANGAEERGPKG